MNTSTTLSNRPDKFKSSLFLFFLFFLGLSTQAQFNSDDGILATNSFTDLQQKEQLIITSDGGSTAFSSSSIGCAISNSLERTYNIAVKKGDPGSCNLVLDLTMVSGYADAAKIHLLINVKKLGFGVATPIQGTVVGSTVVFSNVHLPDKSEIAFGEGVSAYYTVGSGNFADNIWSESPGGAVVPSPNFCDQVDMIIEPGFSVNMNVNNKHVNNLTVKAGGSFNMGFTGDNRIFYIHGDLNNLGTYTYTHGTTLFRGKLSQEITGNSFEIGLFTVDNPEGLWISCPELTTGKGVSFVEGNLYTNDALVLKSTATRTAYIADTKGYNVIGEVTVQRYHNAATGWFMMGSPVLNQTVADWNDDLITTGFTGSDYPLTTFNNIRYYDETVPGPEELGFVGVSNVSDNINPKTGYFIYGSAGVNNLDMKGEIVQGYQELPVSYSHGTSLGDGICLVANPYPCTINWNDADWIKTDIQNAVYIFNAALGTYSSYVNGVGNNGGTNLIASCQGFQVKATSNHALLAAQEGIKIEAQAQFKSNEGLETLVLEMSWNELKDAFTLVQDDQSNASFNQEKDATRMPVLPQFPAISVSLENESYAIKSINLNETEIVIPVQVFIPESGEFTIGLSENNLNGSQKIWLKDKWANQIHELSGKNDVSLSGESGTIENRFELIISQSSSPIQIGNSTDLAMQIDHLQSNLRLGNTNSDGNPVLVSIWNALGQKLIEPVLVQANESELISISHIRGQFIVHAIDPISGKSKTKNFIR